MTTAAADSPTTTALPAPRTAAPPRRAGGARRALAPLAVPNLRRYMVGHAIASGGVWMQNIAVDWLVLQLTGSSAAVGVTMAMQFLPMLLLGLHGGVLADRCSKRVLLLVTQSLYGLIAAALAVLTISGTARAEWVWALVLVNGVVFVLDNPARQVFVAELVPEHLLRGAVALNAAVFQTSRLVGPALAAVLIATAGTGWAFAVNALSCVAPVVCLLSLRASQLRPSAPLPRARGQVRAALRHVRERPHVAWTIVLVGVVGTFGLNFPVVLTAMASKDFAGSAGLYGTFNVALAVGSLLGALAAGTRATTRLRTVVACGAVFGLGQAALALAPTPAVFIVLLVGVGLANLAFQAMANSSVQLWVEPAQRGRVMALYMIFFVGGTPLGAPLIGWVTERFGARLGLAVCGLVPAAVAVAVALVLVRRTAPQRRAAAQAAAGTGGPTGELAPAAGLARWLPAVGPVPAAAARRLVAAARPPRVPRRRTADQVTRPRAAAPRTGVARAARPRGRVTGRR